MTPASDGSRIGWPLRAWLFVEICFGLAAMASIALSPQDSATNFAWPIKPDVTAALLGAFYMSSAWVFVLAAFARRWEDVRIMVIPAFLFTAAELVATFLHWDRFSVGTTPFNVWFASYALPPPVFAACFIWQQARARQIPAGPRLAPPLKAAAMLLGTALVTASLAAFLWPQLLIASAPWAFTPLTGRALCGWLLALGAMLLAVSAADDRLRARVVSPFFVLLLPAVALQLARFPEAVAWTHPSIYVGGLILAIVMLIGLHIALSSWRGFFGFRATSG